jgi:ubiquinone/menaquinone biosynthesis C-methylase UbiE
VDRRYDAIADFYDAAIAGDVRDVGSVALLDFAGDVRGRRLAETACGQGRIARELARRRADVVAVTGALAGETFDGVVRNYGLSDIDDLDGVLATVSRVLTPAGWFVFSILHPCFPG